MCECVSAFVRVCVFICVRFRTCECLCVCVPVRVCVRACMCVVASAKGCVFFLVHEWVYVHTHTRKHIRTHKHTHARTHTRTHTRTYTNVRTHIHTYASILVTKAETTQWLPGLFDCLVGQFFSKLRGHYALKTRFPVLLLDSLLASLLYQGT